MDRFAEYHGLYLERMALEVYGVAVVNVLSSYMRGYFLQEEGVEEVEAMGIPSDKQELKDWIEKIGVDKLEGMICESDSGLAEAEHFGAILNLSKQNGINEARRNKYLMVETVNKAGLDVVKQNLCKTLEEAVEFANTLGISDEEEREPQRSTDEVVETAASTEEEFTGLLGEGRNTKLLDKKMCVVKPIRGAASDSVFLCQTPEEVRQAYADIFGTSILGSLGNKHDTVLVQEFATGTEYAVDTITKNGEHKIAALWRYDKRAANGRSFVYHATELIGAHTREAEAVCDYSKSVLDALDLKWGMTHTEVIMTKDGCRLVEVNCRQHNMDFAPITMACIGYNALDMLLSAYLGDSGCVPGSEEMCLEWSLLPDRPILRAFGAMVHLVNHVEGKLVAVNEDALREIQAMESVFDLQVYNSFLELGTDITATVDIRSDAGWVQLINDDAEAFVRDYDRIVELMPTLFFVVKEKS